MKKLVGVVCVLVSLAGCGKSDDDSGNGGTGGAGGGAGMGGGGLTGECAGVDISMGGPALHAAALQVLNAASPCGFSSCHMPPGKAMLVLLGVTDLKATLVGKPSCEAPTLSLDRCLRERGRARQELDVAEAERPTDGTGSGKIVEQAAWGMNGTCGQDPDKPFGQRMPWGGGDMQLSAERLGAIKAWICGGAPGPMSNRGCRAARIAPARGCADYSERHGRRG